MKQRGLFVSASFIGIVAAAIAADPDGMVGAWNFNHTQNYLVRDFSEHYNCGTIVTTGDRLSEVLQTQPGKPTLLKTDGEGTFFSIPANRAYAGTELTVEIRMRFSAEPVRTRKCILSFNNSRMRIWLQPNRKVGVDMETEKGVYFSLIHPDTVGDGDLHLFAWNTATELGICLNGKIARVPVTEPVKKEGAGAVLGGHPYRLDRFLRAAFESLVFYRCKLSDEVMKSGRTEAFRPAPQPFYGSFLPGEAITFCFMNDLRAGEPRVEAGRAVWKTSAGEVVRPVRREAPTAYRRRWEKLRKDGSYPEYLLRELSTLLEQRNYRKFQSFAGEAEALRQFYQESARYDRFAKREITPELIRGKSGMVPPVQLDVSSGASEALLDWEIRKGREAFAGRFWLQSGNDFSFDRETAQRLIRDGADVGLFLIPHIPRKYSLAWEKNHPEQEDVSYYFALGTASREQLTMELRRLNPRFDPRKYTQVRDLTADADVPAENWSISGQTVTISPALKGHEYAVYYLVDQWGGGNQRIRATFPNPAQEQYYCKIFEDFCKSVKGLLVQIHGDGVYPYPGHEFSRWWDMQGYGRCTANPAVQKAFEAESGIRFEPRFLYPNLKGPTMDVVPGREYLAWMDFNRRNFVRYMTQIARIARENGIRYQIYWGDQHIGFMPAVEGLVSTGIGSVGRPLQGSVDLRSITSLPGDAVKGGRLEWIFPGDVNNPKLMATELRRWQENKRGNLFQVQDYLYWSEFAALFHYDRGCRLNMLCDVIRRVNAEYMLMYKYLHREPVFRHRNMTCYIINNWGALYPWFPWGDQTFLRHFTDVPVDIKFLGINDLIEKGVPEDAVLLINFGDRADAWNGNCDWSRPVVQKPIRKFLADGGGFLGFGKTAGLHIYDALGHIKNKIWWRGAWKPIEWTPLAGARNNGRSFLYGKGRVVLFDKAPLDREFGNDVKRGVMAAVGREGELERLFSNNPLVLPYAYPTTSVLVLHNDSNQEQKTTLKLDASIFPKIRDKVIFFNLIDGREHAMWSAEQLKCGVEFSLPPAGTEYFSIRQGR